MYEAGFATAEDIDAGMQLGANHPMGPLQLSDFIGLDTMKLVADVLLDEYKEPLYAAPPLLTRMVGAGRLGVRTGRGFIPLERCALRMTHCSHPSRSTTWASRILATIATGNTVT
jgi:3-hydroxyacyl-CoA dehydrogenase